MRRVIWSNRALDQLEAIHAHIAQDSPAGASTVRERIVRAGASLDLFAERGRPVRPGVRELLAAAPYILRYRIKPEEVVILRVRHGARPPTG